MAYSQRPAQNMVRGFWQNSPEYLIYFATNLLSWVYIRSPSVHHWQYLWTDTFLVQAEEIQNKHVCLLPYYTIYFIEHKSSQFLSKIYLSFPDCFSVPWIVQVALNCQLDILEWLIWRLFVRRLNPIRIPTCSPLGPDATVCTFVVFGNWLLSARGPRLCPKRGWETQTKLCMYTQSTLWLVAPVYDFS